MSDDLKLVKGQAYDVAALEFGWWEKNGRLVEGEEVEQYYAEAYFQDGVYLGPDADGIEPVFRGRG